MSGRTGDTSMPSAGRALFWGGIVSGALGILGAIGAIVIVSGKAPAIKANAGLVATSSSTAAPSPASSSPPSSSPTAHAGHDVRDEERTDHEKGDKDAP